jgi:hypothetical protein
VRTGLETVSRVRVGGVSPDLVRRRARIVVMVSGVLKIMLWC